jgi:hypothetical protein
MRVSWRETSYEKALPRLKPRSSVDTSRRVLFEQRFIPLQESSNFDGAAIYVESGTRFGLTIWIFNNLKPLPIILHARQIAATAKKIGHAVHI